jgi:hypothetical protein
MKILFLLAAIFSSALAAPAQETPLDKRAFDAFMNAMRRPPAEWQGKGRRVISNVKTGITTASTIIEFDALGSIRTINRSIQGGQQVNSDTITIGEATFVRRNEGPWERKPRAVPTLAKSPFPPFERNEADGRFSSSPPSNVTAEYGVSSDVYKGSAVTIVMRRETSKVLNKSGEVFADLEKRIKYWLASNGRLLKIEQWDLNRAEGGDHRSYVSYEWELDPTIVIREPETAVIKAK